MKFIEFSSEREIHGRNHPTTMRTQISEITNSKSNLPLQFLPKISHWIHPPPFFFLSVIQLLNGLEEILTKQESWLKGKENETLKYNPRTDFFSVSLRA